MTSTGPFLYALQSFLILLGFSIFVFVRVNGDDTGRKEYYHQYSIIIGMYFPGIVYLLIYLLEKKFIKVCSKNVFCRLMVFDGVLL